MGVGVCGGVLVDGGGVGRLMAMSTTFLPLARTCPTPPGSQTTLGLTRPAPPPQSTLVPTITINLPTPPPSTNTQPTPPPSSTSLSTIPLPTLTPFTSPSSSS